MHSKDSPAQATSATPPTISYGITITATVNGRTVHEYIVEVKRIEDYELMVAGIAESIAVAAKKIDEREDG